MHRTRVDRSRFPFDTTVCDGSVAGSSDVAPAEPDPPRFVTLDDGTRWLATVVARLLSEDMVTRYESARLVVRLASLTVPDLPARVAILRARALHSVDDGVLRRLAATPAARDSRSA
jgi:hypothetical protein